MLKELESISLRSITTCLWVQNLIKPVFIMMAFVRAERKANWPLHLWAVEQMMPYFFCVAPRDVFEMMKCGCATDIHPVRQRCVDDYSYLAMHNVLWMPRESHCRNEHTRRVEPLAAAVSRHKPPYNFISRAVRSVRRRQP